LLASACSVFGTRSIERIIDIRQGETLVWNDFMPGSRPRCNMIMQLTLTNTSKDTITLQDAEIMIVDAVSGQSLRRFPPAFLESDVPLRTIHIPPRDSLTLTARTPSFGVEPLDRERHPTVRVLLRTWSSLDLPLLYTSTPVTPFETR